MYHNPVNYAHGLLDELDGALRAGRHEVAADIEQELAAVRPEVDKMDPKELDEDSRVVHGRLLRRLSEHDSATAADGGSADTGRRARTARATAAPESAVPPKVQ